MKKDTCYAMASVVYTVMFVEAYINELFCRARFEVKNKFFGNLDSNIVSRLANFWEIDMKTPTQEKPRNYRILDALKPNILDKYQLALLTVSDKKLFDRGEYLYQRIEILINLRNAIVHYKPEPWGDDIEKSEESSREKVRKNLEGKFKENPFAEGVQNPFFPDKCFGYGCAKWAVNSSVEFIEEFSKKMGLKLYDEWFQEAKRLPEAIKVF
ncbi:MAG TPA: hypothetical protein IGS52_07610 [Oscillatoriaceae cyanobacterium M33_DOE_052]|uniref:Uncharacterized protein n=1 Tax=Planktothricoides sp. SpSt-374 TaxID=2282167 RepID=A0A7C3ZXU7_9CYAN|nr:hypothetical protein [Oscillatoriaceae cyanobacterium M33_DOE_052]